MVAGSGLPTRARSALDQLPAYVPAPRARPGMIELAANEAHQGPFPAAREALAKQIERVNRYPQLDGALIERLAARHRVPTAQVALGNGVDAIIGYLSIAYLEPGDEVITGWPSFPTYVLDAHKQGAEVRLAPLRDGTVDLDAIAELIGPRTRLVWVCSPNNPTGGTVGREKLARFLDEVPDHLLVVVDEAYFEYAAGPGHVDALADHAAVRPNVGALRTFSKIYGLAAMRIGYFIGPEAVAQALGKVRHYYDVGELSTAAALASLDDHGELERRRVDNGRERARLQSGLEALGIHAFESQANFLAVQVPDADALAEQLLAGGVATRSLSGLGEPGLLRIAVGSESEIDVLLELLGRVRRRRD